MYRARPAARLVTVTVAGVLDATAGVGVVEAVDGDEDDDAPQADAASTTTSAQAAAGILMGKDCTSSLSIPSAGSSTPTR